ncbi:hypothetical protein HPB49_003968 [Dermacentor silvarum]|uniref:Uncharacterized protein n=1 Tax=Dermacentor silvarum TaxID=543639 RepID=A0ACB8DU98_DERSI|nr:hypothetical protein HPB49_003968 [Dermacentor silvarum]
MEFAGGSAARFKGDDMIIRLRSGSNIVIVSTAFEELRKRIEKLKQLKLKDKTHPMSAYATTPEYLLKGVLHGINTDVTDDEIMDNICVRTQRVEVLQARRLWGSKTVLLIFDGDVLPRFVYLFSGETPCIPYQPTRQYCSTCQETGHRTDVCPKKCQANAHSAEWGTHRKTTSAKPLGPSVAGNTPPAPQNVTRSSSKSSHEAD